MPNVKISELPAITTPTTSDLVPVVQSGSTDKITRGNFLKNVDADMTSSDVTTNNVTSSKHGFAPKSPADATQFLNGDTTPAFAAVKDSDLSTSDITTNNASTSKHGFLKKLSGNAGDYMGGDGNWSIPSGGGGGSPAYIRPATAPPLVSSLTWVNQSTSTAVDAANGIFMHQPSTATQFLACLLQTA